MSSINSINPTNTCNDPSRDIESTSKDSKEITVIRSDNGSAKNSVIRSVWHKTIVMKIYSFLGVKDLMNVRVLTKMSKYLAILTLRNRAKEIFPDLAQVEGLVSPGLIITRRDQVHEIAEAVLNDFPESFKTLLAQEKPNPTIEGTKQLKEYLDYRSTLVVWQKLADAIGVEDKPDLLKLSSFEAFKGKSAEFSTWFKYNAENLKGLYKLNLRKCNLTSLPPEIGNLTSLTKLYLRKCNLTSLPPEIGNLTSLTKLYLFKNHLNSLPKEIGNLTSLANFCLDYNHLNSLPQEIGNLTSLTKLHLFKNDLNSLPKEIGNLTSLANLCLEYNHLNSLPKEIGNLTSLKNLNLHNNPLKSLQEISKLTNLVELFLSKIQMKSLPQEIRNLSNCQICEVMEVIP